jgi:hypothetical protein
MTIDEAIEILKKYRHWRQSNSPTIQEIIGEEIDLLIKHADPENKVLFGKNSPFTESGDGGVNNNE